MNPLHKEVAFIKARGGSKTKDEGVIAGTYMASLGLHAVHYVAEADMLTQPKIYLNEIVNQSYLRFKARDILKESVSFKNGGMYELLNLTDGKARSRRVDWIYIDEEAKADRDALNACIDTMSVSEIGMIRHGSTPKRGTPFEDTVKRMQSQGLPVIIRPWHTLPFIKPEFIAQRKKMVPAWFFAQEYDCQFIAAQGRVFEHVVEGAFDFSNQLNNYQRHYMHFGLDWNPVAGHYLVGSRWSDDYTQLYFTCEINLGTDLKIVLDRIVEILRQNPYSYLEIEDGGTNTGYCDALFLELQNRSEHDPTITSMMNRICRRPWDSSGKNKHNTITMLLPTLIYVNPQLTPQVCNWLNWATWDDEKSQPTLLKDSDQHPLDAGLHSAWIGRYITAQ